MATDNTAAPNRGIDDILQQTEMGSFISKNKSLAIGLVVVAILGVAGFGIWNFMSSKRNTAAETAVHEFTQGSLKSLVEKKIDAAAFVTAFDRLKDSVGSFDGVFPIGIESANQLVALGHHEQALSILSNLKASNQYQRFILAVNLAVVHENMGNVEGALVTLEELVKSNVGVMEAKVYLDLGRLALELGQNDKARANLQWVIDKGTDAEMTLLARLYLSKLD